MELTKREKRRLRLEKLRHESHQARVEHEQRVEHHQKAVHSHSNPRLKYYIAFSAVGILVLAAIAYSVYSLNRPGPLDNFAKCISEKGAVMYGAMGWCKYTQGQKAMFGNSFKHINYHDFSELPGIKTTPTWVINGAWHENVQSFDRLSALTGCKV